MFIIRTTIMNVMNTTCIGTGSGWGGRKPEILRVGALEARWPSEICKKGHSVRTRGSQASVMTVM